MLMGIVRLSQESVSGQSAITHTDPYLGVQCCTFVCMSFHQTRGLKSLCHPSTTHDRRTVLHFRAIHFKYIRGGGRGSPKMFEKKLDTIPTETNGKLYLVSVTNFLSQSNECTPFMPFGYVTVSLCHCSLHASNLHSAMMWPVISRPCCPVGRLSWQPGQDKIYQSCQTAVTRKRLLCNIQGLTG